MELFVQEADGDLKSRFLLSRLLGDITVSVLANLIFLDNRNYSGYL